MDSIEGNRATFHVTDAHMVPGPEHMFGPPAIGSFMRNFSGVFELTIANIRAASLGAFGLWQFGRQEREAREVAIAGHE